MSTSPQSYDNHRALPSGPYVIGALLLLGALGLGGWTLWQALHGGGEVATALAVVLLALGAVLTHLTARRSAQIVQDRVIRLEMTLRLERVAPQRSDWRTLPLPMIIALRFASDGEIPGLLDRIAQGGLGTPDAVKRAVAAWQPDTLRV